MANEELRSKLLDILETEQNQLKGCLDPQTDVQPPETISIVEAKKNSDGTLFESVTEQESNYVSGGIDSELRYKFSSDADTLREYCKIVDDEIISINSQINVKKQEIVILSQDAISRNCWPGIARSAFPNENITQFYGENVTVNNEIENIKIYSNMAGPDVNYNIQNPFDPDEIKNLTTTYSGYGYQNLVDPNFYKDEDGIITGSLTDGSGDGIGTGRFDISETLSDHSARTISVLPTRIYDGATGTNPGPTCVGIGTSIRLLYDDIIALRIQRDALRGDLNTIKNNKSEKELSAWGIEKINAQIAARESKNAAAIAAIQNSTLI